MSILNLDSAFDKSVEYKHRGLTFHIQAVPDLQEYNRAVVENLTKHKMDVKDLNSGDVNQEKTTAVAGMSMAGTLIKGFDAFKVPDEDGKDVVINFDDPVKHDYYSTRGEELLGENPVLQDHLYRYCVSLSSTPPDYEVRALGKSSTPSDSGDSETTKES